MKTILTTVLIALASLVNAQSTYEKGMEKAFDLWGSNKPQEAINLFERIAKAEGDNWIPYYHAARVTILGTFDMKDPKEKQLQLEKAEEYVNETKSRTENNVEVMVIEALFYTAKMLVDVSTYGATLSPKIEGLYQQAKAMAPNNPRVIAQYAEWNMGSAKFFGKDTSVYCSEFERAIPLFDTEKESVPFYPKWGKERAQRIFDNCGK